MNADHIHGVHISWSVWSLFHTDVIKWKLFPRYWPFVQGFHQSPVNSPHKGQWHGAVMFSLISAWINGWVNNRKAGDLRRHRAYYDVTVMFIVGQWGTESHIGSLWPTLWLKVCRFVIFSNWTHIHIHIHIYIYKDKFVVVVNCSQKP